MAEGRTYAVRHFDSRLDQQFPRAAELALLSFLHGMYMLTDGFSYGPYNQGRLDRKKENERHMSK
jgi:hypothetical protein